MSALTPETSHTASSPAADGPEETPPQWWLGRGVELSELVTAGWPRYGGYPAGSPVTGEPQSARA